MLKRNTQLVVQALSEREAALLLYSDAIGIEERSALIQVIYFSFTETKKQSPNTGACANYSLHT